MDGVCILLQLNQLDDYAAKWNRVKAVRRLVENKASKTENFNQRAKLMLEALGRTLP